MQPQIIKKTDDSNSGIIFVPYIFLTVATYINNEPVWYRNKWKNFFLKIKYFFIKPKYLKNHHLFPKKKINESYYQTVKLQQKPTNNS